MASIHKDGKRGARYRIDFTHPDGSRRSLRLGKCSRPDAERLRARVEYLVSAVSLGIAPDLDATAWLARLPDLLHDRLARCGLVAGRNNAKLGAYLAKYIASFPPGTSPLTIRNLKNAADRLTDFFGADRLLHEISEEKARAWVSWLRQDYAESTIGRTIKRAKQFFRQAVREKLVRESPFAVLRAPPETNDSRKYFVTRDEAARVLEACPDWRWRLVFALARFGGVRCPTELVALKWEDVNWERSRFMVAWKTAPRWVPIFPELAGPLNEAWEHAQEGATHVLPATGATNLQARKVNWRSGLKRIIKRAGLTPWPKLFQNLRSTRQTELADEYPGHVVCAWLGNSEVVAAKHYLQVREEHFEQATAAAKDAAPKPGSRAAAAESADPERGANDPESRPKSSPATGQERKASVSRGAAGRTQHPRQ